MLLFINKDEDGFRTLTDTFFKRHKRKILLTVGFLLYYLAAYIIMKSLGIGCVFRHFLGIPCPGCGMTRAAVCLLRLDFVGAVKNNVTVFFMPYVFAYVIFDFKSKIHKYILAFIAVVATVNWSINVFTTLL